MNKAASPNEEAVVFNKRESAAYFKVGVPVFVELTQKTRRLRAQATLIGWSPPEILITTLPLDSRMLIIPTGTELIVRYLLDGAVYGFMTRLMHKQQEPYGMWILDYPEVVEVKNLRRSPRIPLYLKADAEGSKEWEMLDISNFGACLAAPDEQFVGDVVILTFALPDGAMIEKLRCSIVRVNASQQESIVGVQFDEDNADALLKVKKYIDGCVKRQIGGSGK
jgi:hypothetical protein